MRRWLGPILVAFVACVWLNQSVGLLAWEKLRYGVFTDPAAHVVDAVRYPLVFLYRRSADEALYYGTAAQILGSAVRPRGLRAPLARARDGRLRATTRRRRRATGTGTRPGRRCVSSTRRPSCRSCWRPKLVTAGFEPYAKVFGALMGICMVLSIALAVDVVRRAGAARDVARREVVAGGGAPARAGRAHNPASRPARRAGDGGHAAGRSRGGAPSRWGSGRGSPAPARSSRCSSCR